MPDLSVIYSMLNAVVQWLHVSRLKREKSGRAVWHYVVSSQLDIPAPGKLYYSEAFLMEPS